MSQVPNSDAGFNREKRKQVELRGDYLVVGWKGDILAWYWAIEGPLRS